jgi:hypothetical protein
MVLRGLRKGLGGKIATLTVIESPGVLSAEVENFFKGAGLSIRHLAR